ncbi:hypothetical protein pdam_00020728 [Pocillopora damicornis]|uniref:Uncharacterized protein n=1 Tax=Pocillopora damicornis TaxID=46731 RepID=A0A3M6TWA2_POCDA|nr:hypothetical protein pdam_00020728 [Pocillopora damicornis]
MRFRLVPNGQNIVVYIYM